jgi:SAM-dependent methyltransferase
MEAVDDKIDIMDMHIYKDNSVDIFLCSHVLEHVSDDRKAISELYRILKSGGWGIIMVPILLHLKDIYEDPSVTSEAERWKHFGQGDHLRTYSKEGFKGRLAEGGFRITELGIEYFGADTFEKCGIYPRSVLYIVEKKATQDLNQLNL